MSLILSVQTANGNNLLVTATPQFDEQGNFTGTFGVFRDITDRKRVENELIYKSTHDSLTGLYNRAYFEVSWYDAGQCSS